MGLPCGPHRVALFCPVEKAAAPPAESESAHGDTDTGRGAVRLARLTGGQEVGGSNPLAPNSQTPLFSGGCGRFEAFLREAAKGLISCRLTTFLTPQLTHQRRQPGGRRLASPGNRAGFGSSALVR